MIAALGQLGIAIDVADEGQTLHVAGCGGKLPAAAADLYVANSGTTIRFLTALVALGHGRYRLDGTRGCASGRFKICCQALAQLGVRATCESSGGCPPVVIEADGLRGGRATVRSATCRASFSAGCCWPAPMPTRRSSWRSTGCWSRSPTFA